MKIVRALAVALCLSVVVASSSCGGAHVAPKAVVDTADRAAYTALRVFQTAEETAYHANAAWPTAAQHQAINVKVSKAYQLIIDVANMGIALPPGAMLSVADVAIVAQLTTVVADIVTLAKGTPVEAQAATVQTKASALTSGVQGVKP